MVLAITKGMISIKICPRHGQIVWYEGGGITNFTLIFEWVYQ